MQRLQSLPAADQLAWLDRWSTALLEGQEPPPCPPRPGATLMSADRMRGLIRQQFATAAELTCLAKRPFTLDGHTVGSAGEELAAAHLVAACKAWENPPPRDSLGNRGLKTG